MATIFIYLDLNDATADDDQALGAKMEAAGFLTTIVGSNHIKYRLPRGAYLFTGDLKVDEVFDRTKRIAMSVRKRYTVFVTEAAGSTWAGLDTLGRDRPAKKTPEAKPAAVAAVAPPAAVAPVGPLASASKPAARAVKKKARSRA
jgi:hypothetical protein